MEKKDSACRSSNTALHGTHRAWRYKRGGLGAAFFWHSIWLFFVSFRVWLFYFLFHFSGLIVPALMRWRGNCGAWGKSIGSDRADGDGDGDGAYIPTYLSVHD